MPAPEIAIDYWHLPANATLRDVIIAVRKDEAGHRDANHQFANNFNSEKDNSFTEAQLSEYKITRNGLFFTGSYC